MNYFQLAFCTVVLLFASPSQADYLKDFDATLTLIEATGPSNQNPDPASGLFCRDNAIGSSETFGLQVEVTGNIITLSFVEQGVPEQWLQVSATDFGTNMAANIQRLYFSYSETFVESPVGGFTSELVETVKGLYRSDFFPSLQATVTEQSTTIRNETGESVECTEKYKLRGGGDAVDIEPDDSGWINDAANTIRSWSIDESQSQNMLRVPKRTTCCGVRG